MAARISRRAARLLAVAWIGVHMAPSLDAAAEGPADAAGRARLAAGETVTELRDVDGHRIGEAVAWRILDAPADRLLRAVADWPHYPEFFPFVVAAEAEISDGGSIRFRHTVDLPFPFSDRSFEATAETASEDGPEGRALVVRWAMLPQQGGFADQRGAWTLRELTPGRTLVELRSRSDAGADVPASLQRRTVERTLGWALDGLRQQVGRCRYDEPRPPGCAEDPPLLPPPG